MMGTERIETERIETETKQEFSAPERLTYLQVQSLEELERLGEHRTKGTIQTIADRCGTVRPNISRYFKAWIEIGYLTEDFVITERGRGVLEWNQKLIEEVRQYLLNKGIREGLEEFVRALVDHVDSELLTENMSGRPRIPEETQMSREKTVVTDITSLLQPGRHRVKIAVFQDGDARRPRKSMAERGLERFAELVNSEEEHYLELTLREMQARSRIDGQEMSGHLASLKYLLGGTVCSAEIRDSKVRIPLEACTYEGYDHGIIWGNAVITVTCSVGEAHMPESTARLLFIL